MWQLKKDYHIWSIKLIVLALLVLSTEGFRNLDFACLADLCPIFLVKFQREMWKSWRWHDWPEKGTIPIKIKIESLAWQRQYHSGNYDQSSTNCEENLIDSLALTILCTVKMEAYFCSETNFLAQSFVNGVGPKTAKDSKQKSLAFPVFLVRIFLTFLKNLVFIYSSTDYGGPRKPFFIEIPNFWTWANNLGT